jgi:hypothetical protein
MEVFGFVLNVWLAIVIGLFFIALVVGCAIDRSGRPEPKWWALVIGVMVLCISYVLDGGRLSWSLFLSESFWAAAGTYLTIGLVYSLLEFGLAVRKAAKHWAVKWETHKNRQGTREHPAEVAVAFMRLEGGFRVDRIINVEVEHGNIVPKVNRDALGDHLFCWTFFWPFYAVSLIIGDLLLNVFTGIANAITKMSSRVVRRAFHGVFKI